MWIARPIYELLPYLYMLVGAVMLAVAWFLNLETLPSILLALGSLSLLAGIVLWLRRKDYRTRQSEYTNKSLDD
jgi:membrane protein YdbS with pleckstrin-like domain